MTSVNANPFRGSIGISSFDTRLLSGERPIKVQNSVPTGDDGSIARDLKKNHRP